MVRRKSQKRTSLPAGACRWCLEAVRSARARHAEALRGACIVAALLVVAVVVLRRVERWAFDAPQMSLPPQIRLVDVPPDIEIDVRVALAGFADVPWSSPTLCADVARAVADVGWVRRVWRVQRFADRQVDVVCEYRRPVGLVQRQREFFLVDQDGVRLPGVYSNRNTSLKIIQGVRQPPPGPGERWAAPDLAAAIQLVELLEAEPYVHQITGVLVHNFGGAVDRAAPQLALATDRAGGRILWGSPVGSEVEENNAAEKLELLRANYRRVGHIDGDYGTIDISVHPDRIIKPNARLTGGRV